MAATFRQFMTERDGAAAAPDSAARQRALFERARAMLSEGHSAKETAYTCGFKDPAYFTRFCKSYTGKTPSQYARSRPV